MKKSLLLLAAFYLYYPMAVAQLWVDTTNYTAEQMIGDFFNTDITSVSNITYSGNAGSMCFFEGSQSNLGINAGLLITSGSYVHAPGPNDEESASEVMNVPGDDDLSLLIGNLPTYDAAIVEFDLVATTDQISLEYVFGSEEYLEYVGSSFNDVFAFFISGGTEYPTPVNIALIPGTGEAVSINNVNQNLNTAFFYDNTGGATVQYDGFTTPLTATAAVTPGETYHIKIGVSDAGDQVFDSGVFLSVESLGGDSLLAPQPGFEALVSGNTVQFSDQTLYATSWFWDFGDGSTSTERSPSHTYAEDLNSHQFAVSLTVTNYCCEQTFAITVGEELTGVDEIASAALLVSSDQGDGIFTLISPEPAGISYRIANLSGQLLSEGQLNASGRLDGSHLPSGAYILTLHMEEGLRSTLLIRR